MLIDTLFSIAGKTAIITGSSQGLGFELARGFALCGANVVLFARREQMIRSAVKRINEDSPHPVMGISGDVTSIDDVDRLVEATVSKYGQIDILISNAAMINRPRENTWELSKETWDEVLDVTLTGTFLACRRVAQEMVTARSGKIICIASTSSVIASHGHSPYIAGKGGVLQFVKALALEAAPYGICVNAIGPTLMRTKMSKVSIEDPARLEKALTQLPLGRVLEPEDVLGAAIFLASKASDMVTGHLLFVDAGHTIH